MKGLAYLLQKSTAIKYHNFYVFSVITDETSGRSQLVAVGAFGKWFFDLDK